MNPFRRRRPRRYLPLVEAPLHGDTAVSWLRRLDLASGAVRRDYTQALAGASDAAEICADLVEIAQLAMTTRSRILDEQAVLASIPDYPPQET